MLKRRRKEGPTSSKEKEWRGSIVRPRGLTALLWPCCDACARLTTSRGEGESTGEERGPLTPHRPGKSGNRTGTCEEGPILVSRQGRGRGCSGSLRGVGPRHAAWVEAETNKEAVEAAAGLRAPLHRGRPCSTSAARAAGDTSWPGYSSSPGMWAALPCPCAGGSSPGCSSD